MELGRGDTGILMPPDPDLNGSCLETQLHVPAYPSASPSHLRALCLPLPFSQGAVRVPVRVCVYTGMCVCLCECMYTWVRAHMCVFRACEHVTQRGENVEKKM